MTFSNLGLSDDIMKNIHDLGFKDATKVQSLSIPSILEGRDVIACAQTGTGKTAAFALPILHKITEDKNSSINPKALVLAPTRELASQVGANVEQYSQGLDIRSVVIYGGVDYGPQTKRLKKGVDIVVATPGRLLDHLGRKNVNFSNLQYLVLDEADRMLDMGFLPEIRRIIKALPKIRQTVLFSATFSTEIIEESNRLLKNPLKIEAHTANSTATKVSHIVHPVDGDRKSALLAYLIGSTNNQQAIVFTRTKKTCDALSKEILKDGIRNMVIHGDRTQAYRTKALRYFKEGKIQVLVATDIAARGLDIEKLPIVVNYELPNVAEDYVHRVGRTGRAGMDGRAITLMTDQELYRLDQVEELTGMSIDQEVVDGFEPKKFKAELLTKQSREARKEKTAKNRARRRAHASSKPDKNDRRRRNKKVEPVRKKKQGSRKSTAKSSSFKGRRRNTK